MQMYRPFVTQLLKPYYDTVPCPEIKLLFFYLSLIEFSLTIDISLILTSYYVVRFHLICMKSEVFACNGILVYFRAVAYINSFTDQYV